MHCGCRFERVGMPEGMRFFGWERRGSDGKRVGQGDGRCGQVHTTVQMGRARRVKSVQPRDDTVLVSLFTRRGERQAGIGREGKRGTEPCKARGRDEK
jgi:hypothetical protein